MVLISAAAIYALATVSGALPLLAGHAHPARPKRCTTSSLMILIVDDDPSVVASLGLLLKQNGYASQGAADPEEALGLLEGSTFDLVLQDMNFSRGTSGEEGLDLLARTRTLHPDLPVILITAWGSIGLAVEGIKRGASDFITKPWSNGQILQAVQTALSLKDARSAEPDKPSRADLDARCDFKRLVGTAPKFVRILDLVARIAPTDASVLITGESGTGKELIADAIHRNSRRAQRSFVKVNLGGISSTLFESEMFGHVRGAFTDARTDRKGRFEVADGGTIFLDEIGELDLASQVKLLRVLQDRTYEVLGSSKTRTVDVRVVSATNRDLAELVEQGTLPRGPALPPEPHLHPPASPARAHGGPAHAGGALPAQPGPGLPARAAGPHRPRPGMDAGAELAGQRPAVAPDAGARRSRPGGRPYRPGRSGGVQRPGGIGPPGPGAAGSRVHDPGADGARHDREVRESLRRQPVARCRGPGPEPAVPLPPAAQVRDRRRVTVMGICYPAAPCHA